MQRVHRNIHTCLHTFRQIKGPSAVSIYPRDNRIDIPAQLLDGEFRLPAIVLDRPHRCIAPIRGFCHQRASPCSTLNQSIARPWSLKTCLRFPADEVFAITALASPVKVQMASTSLCSARTFSNSLLCPETMFTTPPGRSLVSKT